MWCGSMIYASQDPDSSGFVVFLTVVVATMNIGMLVWLVLRLLGECVREQRESRRGKKSGEGGGGGGNRVIEMVLDLDLAMKRWRSRRMTDEARQTRIRRRTIDAEGGTMNENPALQIEQMKKKMKMKMIKKQDNHHGGEGDIELTTSSSNPMHKLRPLKKLQSKQKASKVKEEKEKKKKMTAKTMSQNHYTATSKNTFNQPPTTASSQVEIKIEDDPGRLDDEDAIEILAAASGRRYSYNNNTGESTWLDASDEEDNENAIEILADDNGRRYSYNNNTGESTWLDDNESD